jgi:hypothetical protein
MIENGKLRRGLAAFINDQSPNAGLQTVVAPDDDIYFAPAIAGGTGARSHSAPAGTRGSDDRKIRIWPAR